MTCSQMIDIEFKDLTYEIQIGYRKPKKEILKGLSGFFRSTELTAIIGPSGAGKTTLLNILSGFQKSSYKGKVEYYSEGDKQDLSSYKKQRCYIQQMNYLHAYFTVHEIITITSCLKINQTISCESRQMLINDILNMLKLSHAKETRVNLLSGGEKKKLSIALELINNPLVMFLDEPTTGLDSLASIQCMTVLKTLAQTGKTIICSIHQPSAVLYEIFDHIYLVVDGHCMYRSSPHNTVNYLARQGLQCPKYHNPADYMLEVVFKEYGNYDEQLIAAAKSPAEPNDEARPTKSSCNMIQEILENNQTIISTSPPTELMQFWILLKRCALLSYRDYSNVYLTLAANIFLGVLVGQCFNHIGDDASKPFNNITFLTTNIVYFYYVGSFPATLKFPLEINIVQKEHFNNWYRLRTYYVAMLVCRIPLLMMFVFFYSSITYLMTRQPFELSRFFMYLVIANLSVFISDGMGLSFGTVFVNSVNAMFVTCMILCNMILLSGSFALLKYMPRFLYYISYLNAMRYSFDGLMQSIFGNHREKLHCPIVYCYFQNPSTILEEFDLAKSMFWLDVVVLFGYFIMFHVLCYMLLKKRLSKRY